MANSVTINLRKDEILLKINQESGINEILEELEEKIPKLKKLYKEESTPIYVMGKVLKNKEAEKIREMIKEQINVDVKFESPKVLGLHSIKKVYEQDVGTSETKFYKGTLRAGQKLEFEGSIVIIGDVNSGAEVIAGENIAILGHLRGLAHAGAKGNKKAIISANVIQTSQIRIANMLKELNRDEDIFRQAYVYIQDDNIIID